MALQDIFMQALQQTDPQDGPRAPVAPVYALNPQAINQILDMAAQSLMQAPRALMDAVTAKGFPADVGNTLYDMARSPLTASENIYKRMTAPQGEGAAAVPNTIMDVLNMIPGEAWGGAVGGIAGRISKAGTPFAKWFGRSKMVDESGAPIKLFHGTNAQNIESFAPQWTIGGQKEILQNMPIFMAPDPKHAEVYAHSRRARNLTGAPSIYPVYARIEKPLDMRELNNKVVKVFDKAGVDLYERYGWHPYGPKIPDTINVDPRGLWELLNDPDIVQGLKAQGYDGAILSEKLGTAYAAFDPKQVKSAFNRGTWDRNDPRILYGIGGATLGRGNEEQQ